MQRKSLAVCLLLALCYLLPYAAFALPLPPSASCTFTGSFWSAVNDLSMPIAGDIDFQLIEQRDVGWALVDSIDWHFSGSTSDGNFSFTGTLWNDFHLMWPTDTTTWNWHNWTADFWIEENLPGSSWQTIASGRGAGPDWNVFDNSFFLPAELNYGLRDNYLGMGSLSLTLSHPQVPPVAPVPEPATLLLVGSGMSALFFARRRQK